MSNYMVTLLLLAVACQLVSFTSAHNEVLKVLLEQKDLTPSEVQLLRPFFEELQRQYDYLYSLKVQNNNDGSSIQPLVEEEPLDEIYVQTFDDLRGGFAEYLKEKPTTVYDNSLPTLRELIGSPAENMTLEERLEFEDIESIMQDFIDEAQEGVDDLIRRALEVESHLISLNKPRIVMTAIAGLEIMYKYWARGSRAAYCSYSHVPQFQVVLNDINDGVDCYKYTKSLVQRIEDETVASVKEIRRCVRDLVQIYKRIASKNTITGKILSATLNLFRALRRVHDIIAVGIEQYGNINNELPGAALQVKECGLEFRDSIPHMIESVQNLTTCIIFTDTDKPDYEFMKPEDERYWNIGGQPPEIPHEDIDGEDDDDYVDARADNDYDDDDYVDHR